jgi:hypothetical protein
MSPFGGACSNFDLVCSFHIFAGLFEVFINVQFISRLSWPYCNAFGQSQFPFCQNSADGHQRELLSGWWAIYLSRAFTPLISTSGGEFVKIALNYSAWSGT